MHDVDFLSRLATALRKAGVQAAELGSGETRIALTLYPDVQSDPVMDQQIDPDAAQAEAKKQKLRDELWSVPFNDE